MIFRGENEDALRVLKQAQEVQERNFGTNDPLIAPTFSLLSQCYEELGNFTLATKNATKALKLTVME